MELKHRERIVQVKIVYYGPALGGKTTNLQLLHTAARQQHRGEFVSVNSTQDRTILFDLFPLKGIGLHGFEIRFQLIAVPGQALLSKARRLVISGADAVVFVANSALDRLHENVTSLREMNEYLAVNQLDPATIPLVFQHNKRDLPEVASSDELRRALAARPVPHLPAVAIRGEGVLETFHAIAVQTMHQLCGRYESLRLPPDETAEHWTVEALQQVFGKASIAGTVPPDPRDAPRDRRIVRVYVPRARDLADKGAGAPPDDRPRLPGDESIPPTLSRAQSQPALIETYARAAMELSATVERVRDERDEARRRLEQLEHALRAIDAVELGRPAEPSLRDLLQRMAAGSRGRGATLLASGPNRTLNRVTSVGLGQDPFLRRADGVQLLRRLFVPLPSATLFEAESHRDIAETVAPLQPPVQAVVAVPVRSALGLHGLALLYYGRTDPLPAPEVLTHLQGLARMLAAWFSVHRALTLRATAAAQGALPEIQRVAQLALDLVRQAARDPEGATAILERAELKILRVVQELERIKSPDRGGSRLPPPSGRLEKGAGASPERGEPPGGAGHPRPPDEPTAR